ncbi:MAG TPA: hypothetical protein VFU81_23400 [Thermomicrobiales bacterium]|nr:hypothetical protein [Thermomicrobiales bacterium]
MFQFFESALSVNRAVLTLSADHNFDLAPMSPGAKDAGLTPITRLQPAVDWSIVDSICTIGTISPPNANCVRAIIQPALAGLLD